MCVCVCVCVYISEKKIAMQSDMVFLRKNKQHIECVPLILTLTPPQLSLFIGFVIKRPRGMGKCVAHCGFSVWLCLVGDKAEKENMGVANLQIRGMRRGDCDRGKGCR